MEAIFVFDDPPSVLTVYESLDHARELVESLDVVDDQLAFTAVGQMIEVVATHDLFCSLQLRDRHDLGRLTSLLREAVGPAHLADDPSAYAREWVRRDAEGAWRWRLVSGFRRLVGRRSRPNDDPC